MIIDFHMHVFPEKIVKKTMEKLVEVCILPPHTDATLSDTLNKMDKWGVDIGVLLNIATKPSQQNTINNTAAALQEQNDRMFCFGSVHPDAEDVEEEVQRIKSLGLKGIKLHPDYQNFFLNESRADRMYKAIEESGLPLVIHAGYDPVSPEVVHAEPYMIADVLDRFPKLTLIAAHFGSRQLYDDVEKYLVGRDNVYFDTGLMPYEHGCPKEQFERIVRKHGADKILFASDCPWGNPAETIEYIESTSLSSAEKELIYSENAKRLLKI